MSESANAIINLAGEGNVVAIVVGAGLALLFNINKVAEFIEISEGTK